ncbi:hypothetical protein [Arthrobacter sp. STN4]|uniref:hypothetical protein n=1 Tax=Arthrobacter sp. STN4 TaxID=2923276 RepID=UPI00211A7EAB|nr:hypothetical protein [Arthrobacter sp. STN4]MCQ9166079.1 hypothetical protein [Arthrobacter sp. STN4]
MKNLPSTLATVISHARWNGPDSDKFRSQWDSAMRPQLRSAGNSLASYPSTLVAQAIEQE